MNDKQHRRGYRINVSSVLHTQKQSLLTGGLLVVIVMLLVGIFSQLQPPPTNTPPDGVTVIDYTTFVRQVKAGNVLAVMIQGNAIHGLLAVPFSEHATSVTRPSRNYATDIAEWSRYVSEGYLSQRYAPAHVSQQSKALSPPNDRFQAGNLYLHSWKWGRKSHAIALE